MPGPGGAVATARVRIRPEFLDGFARGRRFGLWVEPSAGVESRGAIVCVQPFGDEATLARRVLAKQARRLASAGWSTLILDLHGTGDSDGETREATLALWRDDLSRACRIVREHAPGRLIAWGTRMGALLAAELLREATACPQAKPDALILWQPPASGAALIDPLRRLAGVGALARPRAADGGARAEASGHAQAEAVGAARPEAGGGARVDGGGPVRVDGVGAVQAEAGDRAGDARQASQVLLAGYLLREDLVEALAALQSTPAAADARSPQCPVLLLGVQRVPPAGGPPKALADIGRRWLDAGHPTTVRAVQGEPFWTSLEPSTPLAAFEATESFVGEAFSR